MKKNFSALPALIILSWTTSSRDLRDDKICKKVRSKHFTRKIFCLWWNPLQERFYFQKFTKPLPSYVLQYGECLNVWQQASYGRLVTVFWLSKLFMKCDFSQDVFDLKNLFPQWQWYSLNSSTQYGIAKLYWPEKLQKAGWMIRNSTSQTCSRAAKLGKLSSLSFSAE